MMKSEQAKASQTSDICFSRKWHMTVLAIIYGALALLYILLQIFV